jgi:CxxC motif-containing protein (DUF1111 family)
MNKVPNRHRLKLGQLRRLSTHGLPLALTLLLAACGGGDSTTSAKSVVAGVFKAMGIGDSQEVELTPVSAIASSLERGNLAAAAAIDHDDGTRWASGFTDDEYLTLDFGQSQAITRVRINWENAHASHYLLQVSEDNVTWNTIKDVDNSQGGVEDWTGLNGQGRYLRMKGIKRSSPYGYSIFEIQAFTGTPAETPPPPPPEPPPVDTTQPGVAVKPVTATSSKLENDGMPATLAIDGKPNTRWASDRDNGAWIQFDFGVKTPIGYMKLLWENAYGKQYKLQVSDDGQNWATLRSVDNGKGGTEEFFNLGANSRYIRLQGVARATDYGYSLFEVEFKTPGSDNSLSNTTATSAFKFPTDGTGLAPLPTVAEPLEVLQFTLADGTLVTRWGERGLSRHGRERGEEWNEIGYGINETINPMTGEAQDKGPGNYLTFVPNYFKNRTWGLEIIDNSRVAGVTAPKLILNQYHQVGQKPGGVPFIRAFDNPNTTGYGWMTSGDLQDNNVYDARVCELIPYPANGKLANANLTLGNNPLINGGCTTTLKDFPGHAELDVNGFRNGNDVKARPLKLDDSIEISPSFFSFPELMAAKGDNGGNRYYGHEWTYVVGKGIRPWYGVQPRLNNVPLPDEVLQGGLGSVSYDYTDNATFIFQQHPTNIGMQNMQRFVEGRRLIHTNFTTGDHNEPGNDRYQAAVGLQGQRFNQSACIGCHVNNGRSPAPFAAGQRLDSMSVRVATTNAAGQQLPHALYGTAVAMNAVSASGAPQDWGTSVRVSGFETNSVTLADGTAVQLRKPTLAFDGPTPEIVSLRSAQPMLGTGLLEAIPEATILAQVRTTPDADGVKGTANFVFDPETGATRLGRFGWKASKATLRHQTAAALLLDMAVTSPVYPNRSCAADPAGCSSATPQPGISEADLKSMSRYLELLAVPAQRSLVSGFPKGVAPLPELDVDPVKVKAGSQLFAGMRCVACHTAEMKTGDGHLFAELRNQTIKPYTDLLLHDMGAGLSDKFVEGQANGYMWRTSPLWGIGYTEKVMGNGGKVGYLHDGRARDLTEAIMWHGGEATTAKQRFAGLSKTDRDALLAFLKSL